MRVIECRVEANRVRERHFHGEGTGREGKASENPAPSVGSELPMCLQRVYGKSHVQRRLSIRVALGAWSVVVADESPHDNRRDITIPCQYCGVGVVPRWCTPSKWRVETRKPVPKCKMQGVEVPPPLGIRCQLLEAILDQLEERHMTPFKRAQTKMTSDCDRLRRVGPVYSTLASDALRADPQW